MTTRDITFRANGTRLAGTLTLPTRPGPFPAALLLSGSGPLDRDSNMKRQRLNVMRDMADHLADEGLATLRYDKRGIGASEGDYHTTGFHDNVADAAAAVAALRQQPDVATVFVIGHSEGALIASRLAATGVAVEGAVLVAGSARSGEDTLRYQVAAADRELPRLARLIMKLLRTDLHKLQTKRMAQLQATTTDSTRIQMAKVNAKWFREFMAHDPAADLPSITAPLLAITGEKDLQVPAEDLEVMERLAGGPIEIHRPEHLTHILRNDPNPPSLKDYRRQMKEPTDTGVMDLVADWIARVAASRTDGKLS